MMRRDGFEAKEEGQETNYNITKISGKAPIISSSRQWSSTFKNPRIVRVSRAFGGKDRHSKVCTIRGLRDRRIRLSVPTAIQLYDLQDRLGLNQPSKVVDWLLEVTKNEIDKLPPLQIPPGSFNLPFDSNTLNNSSSSQSFLNSLKEVTRMSFNLGDEQLIGKPSKDWELDATSMGLKLKEVQREIKVDQDGIGGYYPQVSAQNLFPSTPNFINNGMPYNVNPCYHFEPSTLSLSQFGSHGLFAPQTESANSGHLGSLPSSSSLPSASPFFISPPDQATPSAFPQYNPFNISASGVNDTRQFNNFLSYPFMSSLSSTSKEGERQPDKRNSGT